MLWNDAELQNLVGLGKEIVVERFMKKLGAPENDDLFQKVNFSYLWGLIGVSGVKGTSVAVRHKIWDALVQFGVVSAFDKGFLADYNRNMAEQFTDGRLKAWKGLDNFQASVKFRKTVLEKLVKTDASLAQQVSPFCVDYKKLMEQLDEAELTDKLKAYLERFRGMGAACGVTTDAVAAIYEKTDVLRKLCDVAAYTHRKLAEWEKDYLFSYLFDAVNDGFSPKSIGLDDAVLAKLMADEAFDGLSELEAEPLLARNAEIEDFAAKFEDEFGFYEETEAKFIKHEFGKIRPITERCLKHIQKDVEPKGVVFAMMLVELNQIKSAVQILLELAKKGKATELIGFLHRLLPKVNGSEAFILDIICINLQNFHGENDFFVEYTARRTLTAVRVFIEEGCVQQAAALLKYLVLGNWFLDKNELVQQFILFSNTIMILDDNLTQEMCFLAQQLKLGVFETDNGIIIGTKEDNPLTMDKHKLEQFMVGTSMLNLAKYADENTELIAQNNIQPLKVERGNLNKQSSPRQFDISITDKTETQIESNDGKQFTSLLKNVYKTTDEIVIPQKIQDNPPELPTYSFARPAGSIPSSADILRSYTQKKVQEEVVSHNQENNDNIDVIEISSKLSEPLDAALLSAWDNDVSQNKKNADDEVESFSANSSEINLNSVSCTTPQDDSHQALKTGDKIDAVENTEEIVDIANVSDILNDSDVSNTEEVIEYDPAQNEKNDSTIDNETAIGTITEVETPATSVTQSLESVSKFEEWEMNEGNVDNVSSSQKIILNNILNINSKEVDKHFEHIKQIASKAIQKAEAQAAAIKQKVEATDLNNSSSVNKIKAFAQKIKFFRKKS